MNINMRFTSLLVVLMIVIHLPTSDAIVLADFQLEALLQHNYLRQLHCTGAMTLNSTLNTIAQNYANYLAANNLFNHSGASGLGENLWAMSSSGAISFVNGSTPTTSWYNEISLYSYSSPGFSSATGHFTQVVWKDSIQLGIGIAFTSNNQSVKVVANYYPAGNWAGAFPANVLPLCTSSTAASTLASNTSIAVDVRSNIYLSGMIIVAGSLFNQFG